MQAGHGVQAGCAVQAGHGVQCRHLSRPAMATGGGLDEVKKRVSMAMPLLRVGGQCRKIILTPTSRHRDCPCCGAKDHLTKNRPNWVKGIISEAVRRSDGASKGRHLAFVICNFADKPSQVLGSNMQLTICLQDTVFLVTTKQCSRSCQIDCQSCSDCPV